MPFRQPYHLSKFDQTRLSYLYEEAVAEGKVEEIALGEDPPAICTPVFIVDKKGSVIGRRVGDFTLFNKVTEDYYYPAPEADQILMRACGQQFHTTMDCVWGFSQLDVDEETSAILSTITPFGVYKTKKLPEGVKQGPSLFQHFQATALGHEVKDDGHPLCDIFVDDTHVGDETKEKHFKSLE